MSVAVTLLLTVAFSKGTWVIDMTAASGRTSNYNSTHVNISYIQQNFDSHNSQQKKKGNIRKKWTATKLYFTEVLIILWML